MSQIDAILAKYDLVELAEKAGSVLHKSGNEMRGNCPLHGGQGINNFSIYNNGGKQKFTCFSGDCGSGDLIDFVMKLHDYDLKTAIKFLGGEIKPDPIEFSRLAIERAERAEQELKLTIEKAQNALADLRGSRAWEKYHQQLEGNEKAMILWEGKGVPREWQDIWKLGYCDSFRVYSETGILTTPTLSIPIFGKGWELLDIRHRLLNTIDPNDKYRPDKAGIPSQPFMTDPDVGIDIDNILVVEGEIKSMVTYITLNSSKWQVLGIPGKQQFYKVADKIKGKRAVICFDPDADIKADEAAKSVNGKVIKIRMKIDDAITAGVLDQKGLRSLIKGAVKP